MRSASDRRYADEIRPIVLATLAIHFGLWWVLAALPCLFAHHQPLAAALAPLMPLVLVGIVIEQALGSGPQGFLLVISSASLLAPIAWTACWRRPDVRGYRIVAHLLQPAWWLAAIMALGISL